MVSAPPQAACHSDSAHLPRTSLEIKVPFGRALHDGRLYSALEVPRGKACACVCPGCGEALIARRASKRKAHFAHTAGADCASGVETAVHLAAKQLIAEKCALFVPEHRAQFQLVDALGVQHETAVLLESPGLRPLTEVQLEQTVGPVRPDVLCRLAGTGQEVAVEIAVTHFIDEEKRAHLEALGLATLEYDLSAYRDFTWETLAEALLEGGAPAVWVCPPSTQSHRKTWEDSLTNVLAEAQDRADAMSQLQETLGAIRAQQVAILLERDVLPEVLRAPIEGDVFGESDPLVWQAAVVHQILEFGAQAGRHRFTERMVFERVARILRSPHDDRGVSAIAHYLTYLERAGAIQYSRSAQAYESRVASLEAFETLLAYRAGRVTADCGLRWAVEAWPNAETARRLKDVHAEQDASFDSWHWLKVSTLPLALVKAHSVAGMLTTLSGPAVPQPTDALFAVSALDNKVLAYWICAGFVVADYVVS